MEPIEVTTRYNQQGDIIPPSFIWRDREYSVISVGRVWQDEVGHHILVMVPDEKVYELIYSPKELRWYMGQLGVDRNLA